MKNKIFTMLIAAAMLLSPAAVFADSADFPADDENTAAVAEEFGETAEDTFSEEPAYGVQEDEPPEARDKWYKDETGNLYYYQDGQPVTGLFKALSEKDEIGHLYYANESGVVMNSTGLVTVPGNNKRYYYKDSKEGFAPITDSADTKAYTYFNLNKDDESYIVSTGLYQDKNGNTYFVDKLGHVKTTKGFASFTSGSSTTKVFVNNGGKVRTEEGWLYVSGDKYRVLSGGAIYTKAGVMSYKNHKYIVYKSGKIRRKVGVCKEAVTGKRYYVSSKNGSLAKNKSIKIKKTGRVYHIASDCHIITGRHKWPKNKKLYFSNKYGYLARSKSIQKNSTGRFFVKKGGLIAVDTKVTYKGKSYIAGKYGYFKTGFFKWKKNYYYASASGVLRVKKGKFPYEGYVYYVGNGGVIHSNGLFTESGKKYLANEKGHLRKGMITWKGSKYYADDSFVIRTSEQILKYNNKFYFIQRGGQIATDKFVTYNGKHYYASSNGSFYTSQFTYAGITITPSKTGVISDTDYKKIFPDN